MRKVISIGSLLERRIHASEVLLCAFMALYKTLKLD